MPELTFQDLEFKESVEKVRVFFLDEFYFDVSRQEMEQIAPFRVHSHNVEFSGLTEQEARNKFNMLIDRGFEKLYSKTTKKPVFFVHRRSDLPLIGNAAFGIVDRNSSMLEIKPVTGCNMNCVFCSVDEGLTSHKTSEFVIEPGYLADESLKTVDFKGCNVQITINAHGEPTIYTPMPELVRRLSAHPKVESVSLITNGTLLTEEYVDKLAESGLSQLNISLNAISERAAKILEGHGKYNVNQVKAMAAYAARKMDVFLSPVYVAGYNDEELSLIIEFARGIGAKVGIQNFLYYKRGRNPRNTKQKPWDEFYSMLKKLEEKHNFRLTLNKKDFHITKTKPLPKPFKAGQTVEAVIRYRGRYPNEFIASAEDRNVTVIGRDLQIGSKVKLKITSDKHNIFFGRLL